MDDRFLEDQRREPDPAFARGLREKLRGLEADEAPRREWHAAPLLAAAAALVVTAGLFAFPSWRVQAQAMLDLFRVRDFAIVQVDEARVQQLRDRKFDPSTLLVGGNVKTIESGPAQAFTSLDAAASAVGFQPQKPGVLTRGLALDSVFVHRGGQASATVDTRPLRELMDAFDVRDLELPAGLDGQAVTIDVPTTVAARYRNGGRAHMVLMQCASPEVSLPKGVDLARLGEIGLRIVGLPRDEAHRMAGAIDWRSTVVVPVLASATSFQQVSVNGERGVYVETTHAPTPDEPHAGPGGAVLWTRAGRMYALAGNLSRVDLLQMAESVR